MRLGPGIATHGDISGWVLVRSRLRRHGRRDTSRLLVRRRSGAEETEEILLPVARNGGINELVQLPADAASLAWRRPEDAGAEASLLTIRRVGRLERTLRMAYRVLRSWKRLSLDERKISGLTFGRALIDLPGAYRIATQFRGYLPYPDWVKRFDRLRDEDVEAIRAAIARMAGRPHVRLLLLAEGAPAAAIQATEASVRDQIYREFTCTVLGTAATAPDGQLSPHIVARAAVPGWLAGFNAELADQAGEWVMLLRAGDVLAPHALYWFACEALAQPGAVILYSDDDTLDAEGGRCEPRFKPDWSLAHLRSTHYVGGAAILRGTAVAEAGGVRAECCRHGNYDLLLRVVDRAGERVHHIPAVLLHRRCARPPDSDGAGGTDRLAAGNDESGWELNAVRAHLARGGIGAEVLATQPACRRIRYRLPETPPLVSVIVPTRDAHALIRQCLESLLRKTTYPRFEILVVDNQSADARTLEYLSEIAGHPAATVLRYDAPFNFSAINNVAVRQARGAVVCLLNNDTEVISPDWLEEMVGHLLQPRVGVVGAKLYYPDGRVQHAGDTVGPGGCANHLYSTLGHDDPGYCQRALLAQDLSAVTAACLLTWRELYLALGGLDEKRLAVAFNDVDYCLRVRAAGRRVVWTPHAELYHHESVSRGADDSWRRRLRARREVAEMRRRWAHVMQRDPFYNPNLSYDQPDFSPSRAPRVKKPWLGVARS
jgi:GT2 family glycosyltransferase